MNRPPRSRGAPAAEYNFQRAYKACIPCRRRKVKCEPVSATQQHVCQRCLKMRLNCQFSAKQPWSREKRTNRSRSRSGSGIGLENDSGVASRSTADVAANHADEAAPPTSSTLRNSGCISTTVLQKHVASGNDAFDILFDAAAQTKSSGPDGRQGTVSEPAASPFHARSENVLAIWEGCRFVKMGWFTAEEALLYTDWFFRKMAPATTPILTNFFASHNSHYWLITQEPVLCCTILMIAARYHTLPGPSGASRGFYIHNRLWQHCQHLILRIMLGQEKLSKAKTRHISTIEALLLLSEWYPLALHFPHETDGWDSDWMMTTLTMRDPPMTMQEHPMQDRWKEDVVEPTRRADRMSWMLVSSSLALAHELGVFDPRDHASIARRQGHITGPDVESYLQDLELRRQRLPSLLFTVSNLLSSRIGCTSIMPDLGKQSNLDRIMAVDPHWARFMNSWVDLTKLTLNFRETFFTGGTNDGSEHINFEMLEQWKEQLAAWKVQQTAQNSRYDNILHIEYQYLRVFANSLAVQGIVERVLSNTAPQRTIDATFVSQARQLNMNRDEYEFIEEVIDGACVILTHIISLADLKCLPMRVLSRMISSSIFLLKALALGVRKTKLQESLHLLDTAVAALLSNPLDDIHLVAQYAELLKTHVSRLRQTFASSVPSEGQNNGANQDEWLITEEAAQISGTDTAWGSNMMDWSSEGPLDLGDWLSLPLDPLMAPFGAWDGGPTDLGLDSDLLDLDFIWNLPP
ncbi:hypothetical protein BJY01DRAFT_39035 [Aspergillus pseudoustus]|uniref:Zn(2)-C6 fungal-type domain-containing protein n=1 Tax=Aspergillus pseudoustus TaxID=1810923 RepID=A0ABR4JED6_9EURO